MSRNALKLRQVGGACAVAALLFFAAGESPLPRLRRALSTIRDTARLDLRRRRLSGRGPEYDRRFFELVLAARDALPAGTRGIALYAPRIPDWGGKYLAIYELAPIPVIAEPERVPDGFVALVYGREPPAGWRVLHAFPGGGALMAPTP